jgi:hypothetical protein
MEKLKYEKPVISKITAGIPNKFGLPARQKIVSAIDGIAVDKLMNEYGSPLFVMSERTIRETYAEARRAFKRVTRKCSLHGRTKPIISMRFAAFFTTKVRGLRWFPASSFKKRYRWV